MIRKSKKLEPFDIARHVRAINFKVDMAPITISNRAVCRLFRNAIHGAGSVNHNYNTPANRKQVYRAAIERHETNKGFENLFRSARNFNPSQIRDTI